MSVQYRPDLGTIGLTPGYPPGKDREYLTDTANSQQTPNYYGTQKSYASGERQSAYGMKINNQSSPISPLSPQDSSQAVSENGQRMSGGWSSNSYQSESSSHSDASLEGQSNQDEADYYGRRQYRHSEQSKASAGYQNSPASVLRPMPRPGVSVQGHQMSNHQQQQQQQQGVRHVPEELYAQSQSNYATKNPEMANVLQFLESALLDDDEEEGGDVSVSLGEVHDPASEGSWADTLEELLAAESGSPAVTSTTTQSEYGKQYPNGSSAGYPATTTHVRRWHLGLCV